MIPNPAMTAELMNGVFKLQSITQEYSRALSAANGPTHNPTEPIVIPTALDRAAVAETMAQEVKAEPNKAKRVEKALKLVDFLCASRPE